MADDTPQGETAQPEAPSNDATPPAPPAAPPAPADKAADPAEVERLRKETEQKDLRIRQLENAEAARDKAEKEAKAKELEDQQQFKSLAEQEKARADAAEAKIADNEKKAELKSEADKLFSDYSPEVRKLAETTGLTLTDTDDTTLAAFKAKLDEVKGMVSGGKVRSNNPNAQTGTAKPTIENDKGIIEKPLEGEKFDEIIASMPGIASMMGPSEES